jgi:hypothetical protein
MFCQPAVVVYLCYLQAHLEPIVPQFVVEKPESLELVPDAASVEEVDEILVLFLGQILQL